VYDASHSPVPLNKFHIFKLTSFPQTVYHSFGDTDLRHYDRTSVSLYIAEHAICMNHATYDTARDKTVAAILAKIKVSHDVSSCWLVKRH